MESMPMRAIYLAALLTLPILAQDGFRPLFDGKTLKGWEGDSRLWSVQNGTIVGSTDKTKITHNTFLIYKASPFKDFVLRAEAKLRNHNSGIQFRSEELEDYVMRGYQADMAEGNWWGSIYEEKGKRGVLVNGWKDKGEKVVKPNDWNTIEISAKGDHMQVWLNGTLTADLQDSLRSEGLIGLQLHAGPPMQVSFRNIRIKELK
jgi:hypothetical protein